MAGSSSTMAIRRGMAATIAQAFGAAPGQSPLPVFCHNSSALCPRAAVREARAGIAMTGMDQQPPKSALPLLALLVLASALGVAVAIALAGAALLLAAPAYADERGLFLERPDGLVGAKLVSVDSESHDDGLTSVVETYVDPFHEAPRARSARGQDRARRNRARAARIPQPQRARSPG